MQFTDTHCHIQEITPWDDENRQEQSVTDRWHKAGVTDVGAVITEAIAEGVTRMVCVGCTVDDSALAVELAGRYAPVWASIGIHPHEASRYLGDTASCDRFASLAARQKVVAVGECGLDYYYSYAAKDAQIALLRFQIELAIRAGLPMIFHVRNAFDDFWRIFDEYTAQGHPIRGVIHSFSATVKELDEALQRGLYIGLNGIMTFTKDAAQLEAAKRVPTDRLLLETDAPFLTPKPYRGTICKPKHVRLTAEFLAALRGEPLEHLADYSTANAHALFKL